jgi:hypothetical protein
MSAFLRRIVAFLFFVLLTCVFMVHFFPVWSEVIPGGLEDTRLFLWDAWWFHRALYVLHTNPFHTDLLFHPFGCSLVANDAPLWYQLVTYAAMRAGANLNAAANDWMLISWVLAGFCTYLLAEEVTGQEGPSLVAGLYVMTNSYILARAIQNWGYVDLFGIPLFLWALLRAKRTGHALDFALAGLALAWTAACQYYYLVYSGLILLAWLAVPLWPWRYRLERHPQTPALQKICFSIAVPAGLIVAWILFFHPQNLVVGGRVIGLESVTNPAMVMWIALMIGYASRWKLAASSRKTSPLPPHLIALFGTAFVGLSPLLWSTLKLTLHGDYPRQSILWRTHPTGASLVSFFLPNPIHALWGQAISQWLYRLDIQPQEQAASLGWVCLAVIVAGFWRTKSATPRRWLALAIGSTILSLGIYLNILQWNLWLPLPFYLLRLVPIVGNTRVPERWMAVGSVAWGMVLALAIMHLAKAKGWRLNRLCVLVGIGVLLENWPGIPLGQPPQDSPVYTTLRQLPRGGVLELPFCLRDSAITAGVGLPVGWNIPWDDLGVQILHQQPILGGCIGRIPRRLINSFKADPFFHDLIALEEGNAEGLLSKSPSADALSAARDFSVSYVLLRRNAIRPEALAFVQSSMPMTLIQKDGEIELYRVGGNIRKLS